jgi:hypothetical protein
MALALTVSTIVLVSIVIVAVLGLLIDRSVDE